MAQSAMAAADFRVHLGSRGHQLVFLCATLAQGYCPIQNSTASLARLYKVPMPDKGSVKSVLW